MANQIIYGRRPVAEAERGRRRVHRVWRAPETSAEELERLCGSPDHQGVVAEVDPYPYGDPRGMLRRRGRCWSRSTRCRTRATSAPSAARPSSPARPGSSIPERRSAAVTAATCKASAGAVEHLEVAHVRNLADWLAEAKEAGFWIWGADAEAEQAPWSVDLTGSTVLVLGGEGKGLRPRVASSCDGSWRCPSAARSTPSTSPPPPRRCSSRPSANALERPCRRACKCNGVCNKSQFGVDRTPRAT